MAYRGLFLEPPCGLSGRIERVEMRSNALRSGRGRLAVLFIIILGSLSPSVFAQHGYRVTKTIRFPKGSSTARIQGAIPGILEGHEYKFKARGQQSAVISLSSNREDIGFSILLPNGDTLQNKLRLRNWSGRLPVGGEYRIMINTESDGLARYTLTVKIE
jgi:hypothetical protein